MPVSNSTCASQGGVCPAPPGGWLVDPVTAVTTCPRTCQVCPGWSGDAATMWAVVLLTSLTSPILVWIGLPFLRGDRARDDDCFGIAECHADRYLGICGKEPGKACICTRKRSGGQASDYEAARGDSDSDVELESKDPQGERSQLLQQP